MTTFSCFGFLVFMQCQMPEPPKATVVVCPPLVEWRVLDQRHAAAELDVLPAGHPLRIMAKNYVKQRDINQSCTRSKGK